MRDLDEYLLHYASEYYDPVKAHEYYMKNRELKGRTTKGMSSEQREAWSYAKDNIRNEKKSKVELAKVTKEKQLEEFRAKAEATRLRIAEKLKMLIEQIELKKKTEDVKVEREKARTELKSLITNARETYKIAKADLDVKYEKNLSD